jgi:sulfur carrier protein ThiS
MSQSTFQKMATSKKRMYGPKGLVVCGFPPAEHAPLADALDQIGFNDRPLIFAMEKDSAKTIREVFSSENLSGMGHSSTMHRAIIMSGFLQSEVHTLITAFRQAGLPRQLWATVTPVSENWTLAALLAELAEEDRAMQQQRSEKSEQ